MRYLKNSKQRFNTKLLSHNHSDNSNVSVNEKYNKVTDSL